MKKLAIAGLLATALSLTALSQQRAAACWGCGGCGPGGFSFGFSVSWFCGPGCGQPSAPSGFGWGYENSGYPSCSYGYPAADTTPQAAPAALMPQGAVQHAAYQYPAVYGYGPYQAPSYWYGR
jgi:hypothetical protein